MKMRKTLTMVAALALTAALAIGGTLAYLATKTETVTNTFTVGEVGALSLTETTGTKLQTGERQHQIIPGVPTDKDPKVAYDADDTDEAVYVFVKIDATGWSYDANSKTYTLLQGGKEALSWTVDSAWAAVDGNTGVFYKELAQGTDLPATSVISGDAIAVNGANVTESNIAAVATAAGELNFTAYAIQQAGFTSVADAWTALNAQLAA